MPRGGKQRLRGPHLTHPPQEHHTHPVGAVADHPQVVGDQHIGQPPRRLQVGQQVEHLGLHRHIQGRDRLIADHQPGGQGQGPGNAHPLALAPGQGVGIAPQQVPGQPHLVQQHRRPGGNLPPGAEAVDPQRLCQNALHGQPGVQGGRGVLKHHLHLPPQGPQVPGRTGRQGPPIKKHLPLGGGQQAQQEPAQGALSAPGLPHQGQGLPLVNHQVHLGHPVENRPLSLSPGGKGFGEAPPLR